MRRRRRGERAGCRVGAGIRTSRCRLAFHVGNLIGGRRRLRCHGVRHHHRVRLRRVSRLRGIVGQFVQFADQAIENREHRLARAGRGQDVEAGLDRLGLRIEQVAHAQIGAGFAQRPDDLADRLDVLVGRGQRLLDAQAVQLGGGPGPAGFDPCQDVVERFVQIAAGCGLRLGQRALDPRHRIQHHPRVGIAVAAGIFGQKPAPARCFQEGVLDRLVVRFAGLRGPGGNRR